MNVEIGGIELEELKTEFFFMKYKNIFFIKWNVKKNHRIKNKS